MNGKHVDPAYELEWGQTHGVMADAHQRAVGKAMRREVFLTVAETAFWVGLIVAICALFAQPAEARQRFVQRSTCNGPSCAIKQQAVVVHHAQPVVQKVVAAPVVHHAQHVVAAPVYAAPVVAQPNIHTQNNWYSVGQPLVQHSQLVAAARDAVAEQSFKASVQGSFQATVNGAGQALYEQPVQWRQPAPVYQVPKTRDEWQPPAEPQPPTFSMKAPSALQENCAGCHANGKAKGGFSFQGMTNDQFWTAIDRIKDGSMPPANPLSEAAKRAVAEELVSLKP